ncbi:helix-turn-helix domain-containing protein [Pedobacter punctiformis]|uniref:Helix-turn-helix transcriptional regulator n=1 Tax=Pedobacter punctiformis TaxID=3004097 RepID=A0ABT4LCN9_9SPHI|nr:helix-turn-helix transcriptional regulator [Pedobacter sp. HCMS5-2]MCZ4244923.1 helix-turn-helix transcriptional regulator [Pedobacter sp. HCMS5-2]
MKTTLNSILAGSGAEFFTHDNQPMVSYQRRQYDLEDAPIPIHNALENYLKAHPDKVMAYRDMAGADKVKDQCVKCLFSNLDGMPDLTDDGVLTPEFVNCSSRGKCKWEGIGCLRDPFGLSERESQIADLADLTNEEIADKLYLSKHTVSTHLQNVQRKVGVRNKKQLIKIRPAIWNQHQ